MISDAFLADIIANPRDDTPRLIYADWLDDHGDPDRAEFIRIQIELTTLGANDPRRAELLARDKTLREANDAKWRAALPQRRGVFWLGWSRGFVGAVRIASAKGFREHAPALFAASPVQELELGTQVTGRTFPDILASPLLASLTRLFLYQAAIGNAGAEAIANCPHLAGLRSLYLGSCGIGPSGVAALARSSWVKDLRELRLHHNQVGDEGAVTLAASPQMARLEVLHLYESGVSDSGTEALACSPHLAALRELLLGNNRIGDVGVRALAGSRTLTSLRSLVLVANQITNEGATALGSAAGLLELTELHLGHNPITDAGAVALATGPALSRLQRLTFYNYSDQIGDEGRDALRARFGDRVEIA